MFWLLCLLCFALVGVYFWIIKPLRFWRDLGVVHKRPWPTLTQIISGPFTKQSQVDILMDTFGLFPERRYFGIYELTTPVLVVRDPELLKQITIRDFDHFTDHVDLIPPEFDSVLQRSLFPLKSEEWRRMRAVLSPSFTTSKIKSMFALVLECAEQFTSHFQKRTAQAGITVEMKEMITRFTNDAIASVLFGFKVDSLEDPDNEFYLMGQAFTQFSFLRFVFFSWFKKPLGLLKQEFFPEVSRTFLNGVVKETIWRRESDGFVCPDMIQLLFEARKESLRKWPASTTLDRVCVKDYTIAPKLADETPLRLKRGQVVKYSPVGIHRDPQLFPNPAKFDPERFNDVNRREIKPDSGCLIKLLSLFSILFLNDLPLDLQTFLHSLFTIL